MSVLTPYASQPDQPFNLIQPSGVANNLRWTSNAGVYVAYISNVSPSLQTTSGLSCSVQTTTSNTTDSLNSWLVSAVPLTLSGGSIQFQVAANPTVPSAFPISWAVTNF